MTVFHAGTARNSDGELITAGGRVLNVVALGDTFEEAREQAYEACDLINFEGKQFRTDIGEKACRAAAPGTASGRLRKFNDRMEPCHGPHRLPPERSG